MTTEQINRLFEDTAYVRVGGSADELRCAKYLLEYARIYDENAHLEAFEVQMADIREATLTVKKGNIEKVIPCKGYLCAGSCEAEAPLYYLTSKDKAAISRCKGKIVMIDGYLGYWMYRDIWDAGAVGFITYDGNANYTDFDIDSRELRAYVSRGDKLPGVNINAKSAIEIAKDRYTNAKITLVQDEYSGTSHNVVADLKGESDEIIIFTAHYDSTSLSRGSYDNMSGCIGLLAILEYFSSHPHRANLRFVFCGSEERGLLGSKAYVADHEDEIKSIRLNINLDMIGCIMGGFIACCSTENELVGYLTYMGRECGFDVKAYQDVYSSDSTPFADSGVPALSFARCAPPNTATIHNSYDTPALMSAEQMIDDIKFITAFSERMANAEYIPISREIPDEVKEKLDKYLMRKR